VTPYNDQVGFHRDDAFEVQRFVIANTRDGFGLRRVIAVTDRSDNAPTAARREQEFGNVRCKAHDALCGGGEGDGGAGVVGDGEGFSPSLGRCKNCSDEGQREDVAQSHEVCWFGCVMHGERSVRSTNTRALIFALGTWWMKHRT